MALAMGLLEDVPGDFNIVSTKIPLIGMTNDDNETTWWKFSASSILNLLLMWQSSFRQPIRLLILHSCWNLLTSSPFSAQCATSMDNGIGDGLVIGRRSMTFQESFEHWPHSPLNVQHRWIMALVVGFLNGWLSMTFQESFDKYFVDGNDEWWQWDWIMKFDENVDDLKDYVGTTCILEPWNLPTMWRHVSYLTMSNFNAYMHNLNEFQLSPHSLLNMRR